MKTTHGWTAARLSTSLGLVVLGLMLCAHCAQATQLYKPVPEAVFEGQKAAPWAFIERHVDHHPRFPLEQFHPKLKLFFPQVAEAFGTTEPHSRRFLLHAMTGWDRATRQTPVLLIPGANDDATRRYARPLGLKNPDWAKTPGLAQHLAKQGFAVFGISFSHYHGCNLHQGEQLANAITRIRKLLGRDADPAFQVDLVTFSKGAMAARCYVESAGKAAGLRYLTPFRGDVRRIVFEVPPLAGLDMMFRYYLYNVAGKTGKWPAPLGVTSQMLYGQWVDSGLDDINSGCWPGQLQMVSDLRQIGVAYAPLSWTVDGNMSMNVIRDGGSSFFVKSFGLEAARHAGGDLIEHLNETGLPRTVSASIVAGTNPVLYDEEFFLWKRPVAAELSDDSDGLVFLKSATYTKGLTAGGAKVSGVKTFPLNHIDISRSSDVFEHVAGQLEQE